MNRLTILAFATGILISAAAPADTTPAGQVTYGAGHHVGLTGAQPATAPLGAVVVDTVTTKTAGDLLDVNNGGTTKAFIDYNGNLTLAGGLTAAAPVLSPVKVLSTGSPYTIASSDAYVAVTSGASAFTLNLPACVAGLVGRTVSIKKVDNGAGAIIVAPNGTDTIEGTNANAQFGGATSSAVTDTKGQGDYMDFKCRAAGTWDVTSQRLAYGAALTTGSPSTWTVTVPTGSVCVCSDATTQANSVKCAVSTTTLTVTGPNTTTDVVNAICSL